jgi:3-methyl-2-oxobutanoate hydroxymethyltransferase
MNQNKLTIFDLQEAKRTQKQLTEIFTQDPLEAGAAEAGGIDIIVTMASNAKIIRDAAPNTFLILANDVNDPEITDETKAIAAGYRAMMDGADAYYTHLSCRFVSRMAAEKIPCVGHVGYVPYRKSWFGRARAVGKHADEAMQVYRDTMAYQDAGAIAVEMEIVPNRIADEIAKRVDILIMSMGSGTGGDVQYLFATDILGTNTEHVPRHAKVYGNLNPELERVQNLRIAAFKAFKDDVSSSAYPEAKHLIEVDDSEYQSFMARIDAARE